MPAGQERALRRRIRSIRSTQKITRAMELIAASRIVRAQQAIAAARPYTDQMRQVVADISADPEASGHWVFSGRGQRAVVVVLAADRGLSGAFNANVLRGANDVVRQLGASGGGPAVIGVGRRAASYFNFRGRRLDASFDGFTDRPTFDDARKIVAGVKEQLDKGDVGEVHLVSTRFLTAGTQVVEDRRLIPLDAQEVARQSGRQREHREGDRGPDRGRQEGQGGHGPSPTSTGTTIFEFEPGPAEILDRLLPLWLEAEVYAALLESAASFHVAQQRAMKAATDNADDLVTTLQRAMNRARQDAITTEIMEIIGGAEALRHEDDVESRPDVYVSKQAS